MRKGNANIGRAERIAHRDSMALLADGGGVERNDAAEHISLTRKLRMAGPEHFPVRIILRVQRRVFFLKALDPLVGQELVPEPEVVDEDPEGIEGLQVVDSVQEAPVHLEVVDHHADEGLFDDIGIGMRRYLGLFEHLVLLELVLQQNANENEQEKERHEAEQDLLRQGKPAKEDHCEQSRTSMASGGIPRGVPLSPKVAIWLQRIKKCPPLHIKGTAHSKSFRSAPYLNLFAGILYIKLCN